MNKSLKRSSFTKHVGVFGALCMGMAATIPGIAVAGELLAQTPQPMEPMQQMDPMPTAPMQTDPMQQDTPELQAPPEQVPGGVPTSAGSAATLSLAAPPPGTWLCLNNPNPACQ